MIDENTAPIPESAHCPRWLNVWAIITVLATFPLLTLGAEVTTKGVGMVDPVGFRAPWHLLSAWSKGTVAERGVGYVIEHSHRVAGFVVGTCTIILMLGLLFGQRRWSLRWLGSAALLAVIGQGVLGIFRVDLHALMGKNLALIHGCTAQLVFALLLSIAVLTSRFWTTPHKLPSSKQTQTLKRLCLITVVVVYTQLVLGAVVRHQDWLWGARLHQLMAFVVLAVILVFAREVWCKPSVTWRERSAVVLLGVLLFAQIGLGIESWISKFHAPNTTMWRQLDPLTSQPGWVRSLHYVNGSLVFATTVILTLWTYRPEQTWAQPQLPTRQAEAQHLEGVT